MTNIAVGALGSQEPDEHPRLVPELTPNLRTKILGTHIKHFSVEAFIRDYGLDAPDKRLLNAGSASVRLTANCINVDVQAKADVDVVCDVHDLSDDLGQFDGIVCNAVLQYCYDPARVAANFHRLLKPGGYLFVDAPWVQPYCPDTPDLYRYSEEGLRGVFRDFEIVESGPSIYSGSALHMLATHIAQSASGNRYVDHALSLAVGTLLYPLRFIRTAREGRTAGAFYLIARKAVD